MQSKTLKSNQAKRNEWAKAILLLVIIYFVIGLSLGFANLSFRSPQLQHLRILFALSIPSLLLTSAVLALGKGCLQRLCELLLVITLFILTPLLYWFSSLEVTTTHHYSRDRQIEESYGDNGACGSSAHSIMAKEGWGPFFYRFKFEAIDTYPSIGKEINGKVKVTYKKDGMTITRDLDEWLDSKGE